MDQFSAAQQNDRRKFKRETSPPSMTKTEAEKRTGLRVKKTKDISCSNISGDDIVKRLGPASGPPSDTATSVEDMLVKFACMDQAEDDTLNTKQMVYERLLEHLEMERYLGEEESDFHQANLNNRVHFAIGPILTDSKRRTARDIRLHRVKCFISSDSTTDGHGSRMVDVCAIRKKNLVPVAVKSD